ncbi:putative medium-chain specific acyl-CoA dehydrogenase [Hyaloraphidium curvatum]|nr:putative medium-chain specific acyl-CoA dehydrogenase [Hyaloraphidium curvatum]
MAPGPRPSLLRPPAPDVDRMGALLPFDDPAWMQDWFSPYHSASHFALARFVRAFMEEEILPHVEDWEEAGEVPDAVFGRFAELGLVALHFAPDDPEVYDLLPEGFPIPAGLRRGDIDHFHKMILLNELHRVASAGVMAGCYFGGNAMSLPCVLRHATDSVRRRAVREVCSGRARMCIAVTEPGTGSDVANIECSAVLSEDGKHFVVNGTKKWITYGLRSDYFLTAVRTGGPGASGVSLLLIERAHGGVLTRRMKMQGGHASQTTFVEFRDTKVPVENLVGELGKGFRLTMANFNSERIDMLAGALTSSRVAYGEALRYAFVRRTFGKLLIEHPVIRAKLAGMVRQIESAQAWLDLLVHQQSRFARLPGGRELFDDRAAPAIALLKAHATLVMEHVAREAAQIFGGLAYTRGGRGGTVERVYRDKNWYAIPGGSEEIMLDFALRDGMKKARGMGASL